MALGALLAQPHASMLLGGALASGRVHHAYLFAGPAGVGKTLAAQLVAQAFNCEGPAAVAAAREGRFVDAPCRACPSCLRNHEEPSKHAHPLVTWVDTEAAMEAHGLYEPSGDRTAPKAIGVRLVRELVIPRLALKVMGGRRKVAIFKDVEFTEGAQNAFLKTLEEPPPDTTFLLLSSEPDALKQTIRSRCLRVTFQPLPLETVAARVAADRKVDLETGRLCAALTGGNLGAALKLDPKRLQKRRGLLERFDGLADDDFAGWLSLAEDLGEKEPALEALDLFESWLHDILLASGAGQAPATHLDLAERAARTGARLAPAEVLRRIDELRRTRFALEGNGQARLQLERLFLAFGGVRPLTVGRE
jgi:DNA polymerase-3 subunit delta'